MLNNKNIKVTITKKPSETEKKINQLQAVENSLRSATGGGIKNFAKNEDSSYNITYYSQTTDSDLVYTIKNINNEYKVFYRNVDKTNQVSSWLPKENFLKFVTENPKIDDFKKFQEQLDLELNFLNAKKDAEDKIKKINNVYKNPFKTEIEAINDMKIEEFKGQEWDTYTEGVKEKTKEMQSKIQEIQSKINVITEIRKNISSPTIQELAGKKQTELNDIQKQAELLKKNGIALDNIQNLDDLTQAHNKYKELESFLVHSGHPQFIIDKITEIKTAISNNATPDFSTFKNLLSKYETLNQAGYKDITEKNIDKLFEISEQSKTNPQIDNIAQYATNIPEKIQKQYTENFVKQSFPDYNINIGDKQDNGYSVTINKIPDTVADTTIANTTSKEISQNGTQKSEEVPKNKEETPVSINVKFGEDKNSIETKIKNAEKIKQDAIEKQKEEQKKQEESQRTEQEKAIQQKASEKLEKEKQEESQRTEQQKQKEKEGEERKKQEDALKIEKQKEEQKKQEDALKMQKEKELKIANNTEKFDTSNPKSENSAVKDDIGLGKTQKSQDLIEKQKSTATEDIPTQIDEKNNISPENLKSELKKLKSGLELSKTTKTKLDAALKITNKIDNLTFDFSNNNTNGTKNSKELEEEKEKLKEETTKIKEEIDNSKLAKETKTELNKKLQDQENNLFIEIEDLKKQQAASVIQKNFREKKVRQELTKQKEEKRKEETNQKIKEINDKLNDLNFSPFKENKEEKNSKIEKNLKELNKEKEALKEKIDNIKNEIESLTDDNTKKTLLENLKKKEEALLKEIEKAIEDKKIELRKKVDHLMKLYNEFKKRQKEEKKQNQAASVIQKNFREKKVRQELTKQKEKQELEKQNNAANVIQKNFRKKQELKQKEQEDALKIEKGKQDKKENNAANVIQKNFRKKQELQKNTTKVNTAKEVVNKFAAAEEKKINEITNNINDLKLDIYHQENLTPSNNDKLKNLEDLKKEKKRFEIELNNIKDKINNTVLGINQGTKADLESKLKERLTQLENTIDHMNFGIIEGSKQPNHSITADKSNYNNNLNKSGFSNISDFYNTPNQKLDLTEPAIEQFDKALKNFAFKEGELKNVKNILSTTNNIDDLYTQLNTGQHFNDNFNNLDEKRQKDIINTILNTQEIIKKENNKSAEELSSILADIDNDTQSSKTQSNTNLWTELTKSVEVAQKTLEETKTKHPRLLKACKATLEKLETVEVGKRTESEKQCIESLKMKILSIDPEDPISQAKISELKTSLKSKNFTDGELSTYIQKEYKSENIELENQLTTFEKQGKNVDVLMGSAKNAQKTYETAVSIEDRYQLKDINNNVDKITQGVNQHLNTSKSHSTSQNSI